MKNKIKILLIVPWYPDKYDENNPSRGAFFEEQFHKLYKIVDITVLVINLKYAGEIQSKYDTWSLQKRNNSEFSLYTLNAIHIPKSIKITSKYISYFLSKSKISLLIQEIDLIHSHVIYPSGAIGAELAKKFNKPFILTEHISIFPNLIKNAYLKNILLGSDYVTAVSNYLKNKILIAGRLQCEVIPNYIDTTKYYSSQVINSDIRFIHISSLAPIKNVVKLLNGFKLLIEKSTVDIMLIILGGGVNLYTYKRLVVSLNIDKYVEFKGNVNNKDLRENLSLSDALIITSDIETFSVVGIEALASGVPVITTKCGGPEDYVTNDTGLFIANKTAEEIAKSLEYYANNKYKFNSSKIKQISFDKFDQSIIINHLDTLYRKVLLNYDN